MATTAIKSDPIISNINLIFSHDHVPVNNNYSLFNTYDNNVIYPNSAYTNDDDPAVDNNNNGDPPKAIDNHHSFCDIDAFNFKINSSR